jgi:hypothetical protein
MILRELARYVASLAAVAAVGSASLCPAAAAREGWVIEERDADFPDTPVTYYFHGDNVRIEGLIGGAVFLVDLDSRKGFLIDEGEGKYAGGTVAEITRSLKSRVLSPSKEQEKAEDPGTAPEEPSAIILPPVRIERGEGDEEVAGWIARHYRVLLEEELVEEFWIAPELQVLSDRGFEVLGEILSALTGGQGEQAEEFPPPYESEFSYLEAVRLGTVVRRIRHYVGEKQTMEVQRVVKQDLPSSLFAVPEGLEKTEYGPLFFGLPAAPAGKGTDGVGPSSVR